MGAAQRAAGDGGSDVNKSMPSIAKELGEQYIAEPNSGCWLWLGGIDGRGYGTP